MDDLREKVAQAIFDAAYDGYLERGLRRPAPGWSWKHATEEQKQFARRQADAAILAIRGTK